MIAYPLEQPLRSLPSDQCVWVVRYGLVYLYSAEILADIANDRYTADEIVVPTDQDWHSAECSAYRPHFNPYWWASEIWKRNGGTDETFEVWGQSVRWEHTRHSPAVMAVAAVAGRELMTYSLFAHRHLGQVASGRALP